VAEKIGHRFKTLIVRLLGKSMIGFRYLVNVFAQFKA